MRRCESTDQRGPCSHEELIKGSITPGKLGYFVILVDDPHTIDHDKIKDIAVVRTVTGGKTVYRA